MFWVLETGFRLLGFSIAALIGLPFIGMGVYLLAKLWWSIVMLGSAWMLFG